MEYTLEIDETPETIAGGTGILLLHPSTGETDRIDTDFLKVDTDHFLVVSTRTTAREVKQKLEYYDVDEERAEILDTLSIERGYSRRKTDTVHYVAAPDDIDGIVEHIEGFLSEHDGKLRISFDSVTELATTPATTMHSRPSNEFSTCSRSTTPLASSTSRKTHTTMQLSTRSVSSLLGLSTSTKTAVSTPTSKSASTTLLSDANSIRQTRSRPYSSDHRSNRRAASNTHR